MRCLRRAVLGGAPGGVTKAAVEPVVVLLSSMGVYGPAVARAATDPQGTKISGN
jgi:hypothetical protein